MDFGEHIEPVGRSGEGCLSEQEKPHLEGGCGAHGRDAGSEPAGKAPADWRAVSGLGEPASGLGIPRGDDEGFMRLALEEARRAAELGEVPIGAVVVYDPIDPATRRFANPEPVVLARACNLRETTCDPAGHAELLAMRAASDLLGAWRLSGCTVYVTLEPCIMCAGLMHQARVDRCVYAAPDEKAGALGTLYRVNEDERLNHTFSAVAGVLGEESAEILRGFFKERRARRKAEKR